MMFSLLLISLLACNPAPDTDTDVDTETDTDTDTDSDTDVDGDSDADADAAFRGAYGRRPFAEGRWNGERQFE